MTRTSNTKHPRMHMGSVTWRMTGVFLDFEYYGRDVYLTADEIAALLGNTDKLKTIERALWRLLHEGLVNVYASNGWRNEANHTSRWVIPADFADRYDRWVELEQLAPGTIYKISDGFGLGAPVRADYPVRGRRIHGHDKWYLKEP